MHPFRCFRLLGCRSAAASAAAVAATRQPCPALPCCAALQGRAGQGRAGQGRAGQGRAGQGTVWYSTLWHGTVLRWHYVSQATCLMRPRLFYAFGRVKDHRNLPHYSAHLKKPCVRQVVLDKWFPLRYGTVWYAWGGRRHALRTRPAQAAPSAPSARAAPAGRARRGGGACINKYVQNARDDSAQDDSAHDDSSHDDSAHDDSAKLAAHTYPKVQI